jgi:hypothetical protein
MGRKLIWAVEKIRGVPQKRASCSQCGWASEGGSGPGMTKEEFRAHNCDEFPAGTRKWRVKPY